MASTTISIKLDDDAYEIFKATRMIHCQALTCKHHMVNCDRFGNHGDCTLKRIYINDCGACQQYESKDEPA